MVVRITASKSASPLSGDDEAWEDLPLKVSQLS